MINKSHADMSLPIPPLTARQAEKVGALFVSDGGGPLNATLYNNGGCHTGPFAIMIDHDSQRNLSSTISRLILRLISEVCADSLARRGSPGEAHAASLIVHRQAPSPLSYSRWAWAIILPSTVLYA
jgi:hypothetical protein